MTQYASVNTKTKKDLKDRIAKGEKITVRTLTPMGDNIVKGNESVTLAGPWYPEPHKWYAEGVVENGILVKVK